MSRLRGGVFGCGMISEFHLRGWQRIPEVDIVALGNRTVSRAEARRDQFFPRARVYDRLETMLEREQLDFVDILTIPSMHRAHCLIARDAGVHVICQKPLCETLEAAERLAADMATAPKLFAVHENHRYRPWFQKVAALHREHFFGDRVWLRIVQYDANEPPEQYKNDALRGVLLEYGTHLIDMMVALFGEPNRVQAHTAQLNPNMRGESHACLLYQYEKATAAIDMAWQAGAPAHAGFVLQGSNGTACLDGTLTRGASSRFRILSKGHTIVDETRSPYDDYVKSFFLLQRDCVDSMLTGRPPAQSAAENLKTLRATFAGYAAAEQGRALDVLR